MLYRPGQRARVPGRLSRSRRLRMDRKSLFELVKPPQEVILKRRVCWGKVGGEFMLGTISYC